MRYVTVVPLFLALCTFGSQSAAAESRVDLQGIGARVGIVDPDQVGSTIGVGVFADLGMLAPRIGFESYLDYWSKSEDLYPGAEASLSDVAIGAKGKYHFSTSNPKIRTYAGAGLGIHFVKAKVSFAEQDLGGFVLPAMTLEDSSTKLGLDLGGGLSTPVGARTDFQAEAWYGLVSDVDQFSLKVGLLYRLGS